MDQVLDFLIELCTTIGVKLLFAGLLLVIGVKLIKWLLKAIQKGKAFCKLDLGVQSFIRSFLKIGLYTLLFFSIAGILGIPTTSFVTLLASAGVAIGLALQGALSNLAGGLMLLIFKPFHVGDFIETDHGSGTVRDITVFYTVLVTPDNKHITLPNGSLTNSAITNYSVEETRRVEIACSVSYSADIEQVKAILLDVAQQNEMVHTAPAPLARLSKHGDNALHFILRVWCDSPNYWTVTFDLTEAVKEAFDKNGIESPYPQLDVHMR